MKLIVQNRAAKDVQHTKLIEELRSGQKITIDDMKRFKPLTRVDMKDLSWRFAPILVKTNRERINLIHLTGCTVEVVNNLLFVCLFCIMIMNLFFHL